MAAPCSDVPLQVCFASDDDTGSTQKQGDKADAQLLPAPVLPGSGDAKNSTTGGKQQAKKRKKGGAAVVRF